MLIAKNLLTREASYKVLPAWRTWETSTYMVATNRRDLRHLVKIKLIILVATI